MLSKSAAELAGYSLACEQNTAPSRLDRLVHTASVREEKHMVTFIMVGIVALLAFLCVSSAIPGIKRQK
jgi:hypothetical protein